MAGGQQGLSEDQRSALVNLLQQNPSIGGQGQMQYPQQGQMNAPAMPQGQSTPPRPPMQNPMQGQNPMQQWQGQRPQNPMQGQMPQQNPQSPMQPMQSVQRMGGPDVTGVAGGAGMGFDRSGSDAGVGGQPVNQMQSPMRNAGRPPMMSDFRPRQGLQVQGNPTAMPVQR